MATGIELAQAWVRLTPTMEGVQGEVSKSLAPAEKASEDAGKKSGEKFSTGMKLAIAAASAIIIAGVTSVANEAIDSLIRIDRITTQTEAVIESTGGAANVTADQIVNLADRLEAMTATEAEAIQEGANLLLTFKDIQNSAGEGNDIFDQSVVALTDMARAMGQDPSAAAIQLGKALNDPIAGISALSRVGVQFTDDQKAMIESMVEAGDVAGAQKIILGELNSQFGGSGAAYAESYAGQMDMLGHTWGTLTESIMSNFMPALMTLGEGLAGLIGFLTENQEFIAAFAVILGGVLAVAFYVWAASIWASTVALLANPITWIILAIVALIAIIILLVANWDDVVKFISEIWEGFIGWITDVIDGFASWWGDTWGSISTFFTDVWNNVVSFFTDLWDGVVNWFKSLLIAYAMFILTTIKNIASFWTDVWTGIVGFFTGLWNGVTSFVSDVFKGIGDTISGALEWIGTTWNNMWQGMVDFLGMVFAGVVGVVKAPINGIIGLINGAIGAINSISITIPDWVPLVGGQTWGLSLPKIPYLAKGGTITASGYTVVGEKGPELLKLPKGAQVNPDYDDVPEGGVTFNNYAPLGQTPAQALTEFANRAKGL